MLLQGKKAAIFNVANKRSIAWAIAQAFAREGAELVLGYQNERLGEKVRALIPELPKEPVLVELDVATDEAAARAAEQVRQQVGELDVMVHSLAYAPSEALEQPFLETSREAFRTALAHFYRQGEPLERALAAGHAVLEAEAAVAGGSSRVNTHQPSS